MSRCGRLGLGVVLGLSLAIAGPIGCGDDGDGDGGRGDGDEGSGDGDGTGGDGDGRGDGDGSGTCSSAAALPQVLAPVELSDGSVIYRMAWDDDYVYFASIDKLMRVPQAGGEFEELYDNGEFSTSLPFFVRSEDIVVKTGKKLLSVPKSGGEPSELAELPTQPNGSLDGRIDLIIEGDSAYYRGRVGTDLSEIYAVDLSTGEATLLSSTELGRNDPIAKSGDYLYLTSLAPGVEVPEEPAFTPLPKALYRLAISGGDLELVEVNFPGEREFAFSVMGADSTALFLLATPVMEGATPSTQDLSLAGVYRVPLEGGEAVQLFENLVLFSLTFEQDLVGDTNFLRSVGTTDNVHTNMVGETTASLFACLNAEVHAMAASEDAVFLGVFDDGGQTSSIVRIDR
jgi:hypothetical protein